MMNTFPHYRELSDKRLKELSDAEKLQEIRRAHRWLAKHYRNDPKAKTYNSDLYVYFADIVQRIIKQ